MRYEKIVSLFVSFVFLFMVLPVQTYAASSRDMDARQEILAIACEAFPEYSNKILSTVADEQPERTLQNRRLIVSESKEVTDSSVMIYSEYSDGLVLLTYYDFTYTSSINNHQIDGNKTYVDLTVRATSNDVPTGYFELRNVQFTLYGTAYDRITSPGSYVTSGDCGVQERLTYIANETASGKAKISYRLKWRLTNLPGGWINSTLTIEVGNNRYYITHDEFL